MNVQISDVAEADLAVGIDFYGKSGPGVGEYFLNSLMSDLRALEILGGIHSKRFGFHCMPAKRFPYAIYYSVSGSVVFVVAILDERRDPEWVSERLRRG